MHPTEVLVWIGVLVFAATSVIAILYLVGAINGPYGKLLVGTLIAEIVASSLYVISIQLKQSDVKLLPVESLMVIEKGPVQTVHDGSTAIHLKSSDVKLEDHLLTLAIDLQQDFSSNQEFQVKQGEPKTVTLGNKKYRFSFSDMGKISPDPKDPFKRDQDFVLLSIRTEK